MEDRLYTLELVLKGKSQFFDNVDPDRYCYILLIQDSHSAFTIESAWCKYRLESGREINCDEDVLFMFDFHKYDEVIRIYIEPEVKGIPIAAISPKGKLLYVRDFSHKYSRLCWNSDGETAVEDESRVEADDGGDEVDVKAGVDGHEGASVEADATGDVDEADVDKAADKDESCDTDGSDAIISLSSDEIASIDLSSEIFTDSDGYLSSEGGKSSDFEVLDSDDKEVVDSETDIDEEDGKKKVKMDPTRDYGGTPSRVERGHRIAFNVGQTFENKEEFRQTLRDYVIRGGYLIKFIKNDKLRITAACQGSCPWRIHASVLAGKKKFMVKTLKDEHTCLGGAIFTSNTVKCGGTPTKAKRKRALQKGRKRVQEPSHGTKRPHVPQSFVGPLRPDDMSSQTQQFYHHGASSSGSTGVAKFGTQRGRRAVRRGEAAARGLGTGVANAGRGAGAALKHNYNHSKQP